MLYFIIFFLIKTVLVVRAVQYEINQDSPNDRAKGNQRNFIAMEAIY